MVSTNASYTFTVTDNRSLTAHFSQDAYTVSLNAQPAEGGSVEGAGNYEFGSTATILARPAEGYHFTGWTENGIELSSQEEYSFTVTEDRSFTAHFEKNSYTVTLEANPSEGGTLSGAGDYTHGSFVIITALAGDDFQFLYWIENGEIVTTNSEYAFEANHDRHLIAVFESTLPVYEITVRTYPEEGYYGFVIGEGYYQEEEWVQLTAEPRDQSAMFLGWVENGDTLSKELHYGFSALHDREIVAAFQTQERIFNVRTILPEEHRLEISGEGSYYEGETATLDLKITDNLRFVGWENAAGQIVSRNIPYSFSVTRNITLKALLEVIPEEEQPELIQVYPNPSNGRFCIFVEEPYTAEIRNTSGFIVWQGDLVAGQNCIDLAYLELGMYLINFYNETKADSQKIIITN